MHGRNHVKGRVFVMSESKTNPFDFIKSINSKKDHFIIESNEDEYKPFLVNRSFSYFPDLIFFANEMNRFSGIVDNRLQFDFYYHLLPKKNRFAKWMKDGSDNDEELIEAIINKHKCSRKEAIGIFLPIYSLMDKSVIEEIKESMNKGGKVKNNNNKKRK
jgi:hypothetical protein